MAKRAVDDLAAVVAATRPDPAAFYNSLGFDLHFVPDEPESEAVNFTAGAGRTKRDVVEAREADARWCTWVGQSCWKVRRAAEAIVDTIDGFEAGESKKTRRDASVAFEPVAFGKREASPEADPRWCTWVGQSCWKRDEIF